MIDRLRRRAQNEDGAAMIAAILVLIVLVSTLIFMTAIGLRGLEKGSSIQSGHAALNAADSALANALIVANSDNNRNGVKLSSHQGLGKAAYGTHHANAINPETGDGLYSWRWYVMPTPGRAPGEAYDIYATGFRENPDEEEARTVVATIQSSVIEGMQYESDGSISVVETTSGSAAVSATGKQNMQFLGTAKTYQYDSRANIGYPSATTDTEMGFISSNRAINIVNPNTHLLMRGEHFKNVEDACVGNVCPEGIKVFSRPNAASFMASTERSHELCPDAASSYPDLRVSEQGGIVRVVDGDKCYNNIYFDVDTTLSGTYSTGRPAILYAKGNVVVSPGVEVAKQVQRSQGPYSLHIITSGDSSQFTVQRNTAANPTKFTGIVVGDRLTCDIGGPGTTDGHGTSVYGSVACNNTIIRSGTQMWWDDQLQHTARDASSTTKRVWEIVNSQEV